MASGRIAYAWRMGTGHRDLRARIDAELPREPGGAERELLAARLAAWLDALLDQPANLTAATDAEAAVAKHVAEPLSAWRLVRDEIDIPEGPLIDVGSGNGAPGLPIALSEAPRPATLLDSRKRAADFLRRMPALLDAPQIQVVEERAETAARGALRERFAIAVTRAAAKPEIVLELLLPFLQENGIGIAMIGEGADRAFLHSAAAQLGGELLAAPLDEGLIVARKLRPTPAKHPRRWASIRRRPIAEPPLEQLCRDDAKISWTRHPGLEAFRTRNEPARMQWGG